MTWAEIKTRLRRYLRDPDGNIWSDADLLTYFNDSQHEIANKTGLVLQVSACYWPPEFTYSYLHDWEREYAEGDRYQALVIVQNLNMVGCYPWEAARDLDTEPTDDSGYRVIHPFECGYGTPADVIPIPLPEQFRAMKLAAWDGEQIIPTSEYELARCDSNYRATTGDSISYYHWDGDTNLIVPYPRPSIVWYATEVYDVMDDVGGIVAYDESWLDMGDLGVTYDAIPVDDTYLFIFDAWPQDIEKDEDEPDCAPYLIKYYEAATLERCYSADTDGFIPTLRDYWGMRKQVGIQAIKKWQRLGLINRHYRLGGAISRVQGKGPRMPAHYPEP